REEDDKSLDDDDHVAGDGRLLEGKIGATLIERAEEDRGENDAERMRTSHQRHRDADKAITRSKFEQEAVLRAHDLIEGEEARERARDEHGDDDEALRLHAGIGGG